MPFLDVPLPETKDSITRPVMLEVTRSLFDMLGISQDTRILFVGETEAALQQNSTLTTDPTTPLRFSSASQMKIEVDETDAESGLISSAVFRQDNPFIFLDRNLIAGVRPIYSTQDVVISFQYRAVDEASALAWRNQFRSKLGHGREQLLFTASYSYQIPSAIVNILTEIHRVRELVDGYGDNFDTYFTSNASGRITTITDQIGNNGRYAMRETATRIQGIFDFTGMPEKPSKQSDNSTWSVSFSFKFQYDKPIGCSFFYPIMVHNQMLDQKWRPPLKQQPPYETERFNRYASMTVSTWDKFSSISTLSANKVQGYQIPYFDEFAVPMNNPNLYRLFDCLVQLDPTNVQQLLNIETDITDITFLPVILAFLKSEAPYLTKLYNSPFFLEVYEGENRLTQSYLAMDSNLNVTVNGYALSLRKCYHVRLSLVSDWQLLQPNVINRIRGSGAALLLLLGILYPNKTLPSLSPSGALTAANISKVISGAVPSSGAYYVMGLTVRDQEQCLS